MSKDITEWVKSELYPRLFDSIDTVFPEHNFKSYPGGWRSKTYLSGSPHSDRADKTIVTKKAPGRILEQGDKNISLVDYVMERDKVDFIQAVKTLADKVNLQLPKGDFNQEDYQKQKDQANLLEECNSYFTYCLQTYTGAKEMREYLSSRGYSGEEVEVMELGYIPGQDKLKKYLLSKGYSQGLIDETVKLHPDIGSTHRLSIPYRSGGSLKGFVVRTIVKGAEPKYLVSTGLKRGDQFFNLKETKGDKDLIVVEGYLDTLISEAKGIDNIVGLGGAKFSREQVTHAVKKGAKSFTLCLDTDKAGLEAISPAIEIIRGEGIDRVYIATLPGTKEEKVDPDKFILEKGVEAFREVISGALPWYEYKLKQTLEKYGEIEEAKGKLDPRDTDNLLEEVVKTGYTIQDPLQRDRYKKLFIALEPIQELGITEESLTITVDRLTSNRNKEAQDKKLKLLLSQARDLQDRGDTDKALDLLQSNLEEVRSQDKKQDYQKLLAPTTEEEIRKTEETSPGDLKTGYKIAGDELLLPGAALSVYAAPTGHGKTTITINTVLNVAKDNPDKKFIFFTYEERANIILQYFLNIYINEELNKGSNRRLIKEYFKTGSIQYITRDKEKLFIEKKQEFFKTYIETGRILIKEVDLTSTELSSAIRYIHKQEPSIGGVFIDYFQLLSLSGETKKGEKINSRQEELKEICKILKNTARDTRLPICLAAQFNREVLNLLDLHPTKLGEAGDIERIANTLIGLWDLSIEGITTREQVKLIENKTGGVNKGIYIEILKSRDLPRGGYQILENNGNTGRIDRNY
jgi:DNA primase catalytic core